MEIGTFINGGTNLPLKRHENGLVIPDASLAEMHRDMQQITKDNLEHAVLAEEIGLDRVVNTEHHFYPTGAEYSPSPLMEQMAMAAKTDDIKLLQVANILSWHDPVRLAEQTSMLDIISDGRIQVGIGRGYASRENEQLGQYWGGTIQDEEQNRTSFEEKFEVLRKAWTEDLFSHHGEFHSVPPTYTKWHHAQDKTYAESDQFGHDADEYINWVEGEKDWDSADWTEYEENMVKEGDSTLNSQAVFPQPLQDPHPPMWQPVTSPRSVTFAAKNAINGYMTTGTPEMVNKIVDLYYQVAEEEGWPDHRPEYDGEPFDYGWDEERQRGVAIRRFYFNTDHSDEETYENWNMGIAHRWSFYGTLGHIAAICDEGEDYEESPFELLGKIDGDFLADKAVAYVGSSEEIIEQIAADREALGWDNMALELSFEVPGITFEDTKDQLEGFGEDVLPYLREEF
jgi:alkanesulfonate monooxygenase SsuD/methylene tetrahydromethanopterin reductase-like flavin-dependent oxidoreductase (luciferase family)